MKEYRGYNHNTQISPEQGTHLLQNMCLSGAQNMQS